MEYEIELIPSKRIEILPDRVDLFYAPSTSGAAAYAFSTALLTKATAREALIGDRGIPA
jgi:hypothetical protein